MKASSRGGRGGSMNWQNGVENPSYGRGAGNRVVPTTNRTTCWGPRASPWRVRYCRKALVPPLIERKHTNKHQNSPPLLPRRKISRRKSIGLFFQKPIFPRKFGLIDGGEEESTFSLLDASSTLYKTTARPKGGRSARSIACRSASGRSVSRTERESVRAEGEPDPDGRPKLGHEDTGTHARKETRKTQQHQHQHQHLQQQAQEIWRGITCSCLCCSPRRAVTLRLWERKRVVPVARPRLRHPRRPSRPSRTTICWCTPS